VDFDVACDIWGVRKHVKQDKRPLLGVKKGSGAEGCANNVYVEGLFEPVVVERGSQSERSTHVSRS